MNTLDNVVHCCGTCSHLHQLKMFNPKSDAKWDYYFVCTYWLDKGIDEEPVLMSIEYLDGQCECYQKRKSALVLKEK